jgi:membrane fusion protein (multidrug efflux system)
MGYIILFASCRNTNKNQVKPPVAVSIYEVKDENVIYYDSYPGNAVALNQVELRSEVSGYVTGIYFKDAQPVFKGQKLYEIDRSKYIASSDEAKANEAIAEDNLDKAQQDADRYTKLIEQDAVAKQRLDYALTDLRNAKLQVISAKAEMQKAQTDLNYSVINAPFEGTIGISQVKLGSSVNSGQTFLNIISSDDPMGVDFVIDEKEMPRFQKLELKKVLTTDSTFRIILPDRTVYPSGGSISLIDRAIDPQTGTIKVRLIFPNMHRILKAGMSCNVQVLDLDAGSRVVIPFRAVVEQMGEYFVFVSDGKQVKQVKIKPGAKIRDEIIVLDGLKPGDKIVLEGVQKLRDGSAIITGIHGNQQKR